MNLAALKQNKQLIPPSIVMSKATPSPSIPLGYKYEDKVGAALSGFAARLGFAFLNHPWLESNNGWYQPDFVLVSPSSNAILFEVKHSYTEEAWGQLSRYARLLAPLYDSITKVQVCKNLRRGCPKPVAAFEDLYDEATWHLYL